AGPVVAADHPGPHEIFEAGRPAPGIGDLADRASAAGDRLRHFALAVPGAFETELEAGIVGLEARFVGVHVLEGLVRAGGREEVLALHMRVLDHRGQGDAGDLALPGDVQRHGVLEVALAQALGRRGRARLGRGDELLLVAAGAVRRVVHAGGEAGKGRRAVPDVHGAARREGVVRAQLDEAVEDGEGARVAILQKDTFELAVRAEIGLGRGRRTPIGEHDRDVLLAGRRVVADRQRAPRIVTEEDAFTIVGEAVDGDGARGAENAYVPAVGQAV